MIPVMPFIKKKKNGKNDDVDKIEFGKYQREQFFTHFS